VYLSVRLLTLQFLKVKKLVHANSCSI